MSDPENSAKNFLQRWSRLKQAAVAHAPSGTSPPIAAPLVDGANVPASAQGEAELPEFDPATLPSIESITAISDIRAFLAPGVPEELTRAALRRVWVSDPTIRDFVGIAENQWDFTKPDGVPGFGSLELTPELRSMVASLFGDGPKQTAPQQANADPTERAFEKAGRQAPPPEALPLIKESPSGEPSHAPTNLVTSPDPPSELTGATLQMTISDVATQKNIGEVGESPRSARRTHGGAVPK
jgi:Protein of unknown function (DUF3306)